MRQISLEELLEAGCHFGHQVTRSNPKARDFIFEARDNIHIIDLAKTKQGLEEAADFIKSLGAREGSSLAVVGTKRQSHEIVEKNIQKVKSQIKEEEGRKGIFFVTNKWIGGLLTNFSEVSKNFKKLHDLTHKLKTPSEQEGYTKKEIGEWDKERQKLESLYGGVADLVKAPDALFIIDSHLEALAVKEAQKMGVPTVAIVDTNSDPNIIDYPIPANDDAVGSLELIVGYITDAWIEGRNSIKKKAEKGESKDEPGTTKKTS
jgi:small subunit ribosomal protein S2